MRSCSEVGIALLLCYQALAHVPAVSCCSSGSVSPGDHHAWLDSKPQRYTDTSVILTPLLHYRERNSVQRGANQGRETGSSMRHLQTRADSCNAKLITRKEIRSAVGVRSSALLFACKLHKTPRAAGTNDRGMALGECHREKMIAEQLSCYPAKRSLPCLRPRDFFKQRPRTAGRRACDRVLCISLGAREYLTPRCYPPPRPR